MKPTLIRVLPALAGGMLLAACGSGESAPETTTVLVTPSLHDDPTSETSSPSPSETTTTEQPSTSASSSAAAPPAPTTSAEAPTSSEPPQAAPSPTPEENKPIPVTGGPGAPANNLCSESEPDAENVVTFIYANGNTSCGFAQNVASLLDHARANGEGSPPQIVVTSPTSGKRYVMNCDVGLSNAAECYGGEGATVRVVREIQW